MRCAKVDALESEEKKLLLALGRGPGLTFQVKNKKQLNAVLAFFQSPEFNRRLKSALKATSKAMLAIEKQQFKKSNSQWKPLFGDRPSRTFVRGRVKAGSAFK